MFGFPFGIEFLVEFDRFRSELTLQAALLKLIGCVPVNQRFWDFLPFAALGAEVADALTVNLILRDGLVGAIFQDEAAGLGRGRRGNLRHGKLDRADEGQCCGQHREKSRSGEE